MLRIKVNSLQPGVELAKDLFSNGAQLLLPAATVISQEHLDYFAKRGITEVFVAEDKKVKRSNKSFDDVYDESLLAVKSFLMETKLGQPLDSQEVNSTVDSLLNQVLDELNVFKGISVMKDKDEYLFTHSINVSILAMLVGRWMKLQEQQIRDLGICGLLHDIGKVFINDNILNKPERLNDEEYEEIKKHCTLGHDILMQQKWVSPEIAQAVLYHHERTDGSGYPTGVKNYGSNSYAAIVAVCDAFDAITSNRVYSKKRSPFTAADIIWEESFGKLNPAICEFFYSKITPFLIGSQVLLSNQLQGTVIFVDTIQPTRPIVKVGEDFYNLALNRSIHVLEVIDG